MLADTIDPSLVLTVISRWLHIAAVIVAVGGTVFIRLVMQPVAFSVLPPETLETFRTALIRRWSRVLHACIAFILLSGIYNSIVQLPRHKGQPLYHSLWGTKVLLALALFFIAIAIMGRSPAFEGMRKKRHTWMLVNIALAGVILLISNILKNTG